MNVLVKNTTTFFSINGSLRKQPSFFAPCPSGVSQGHVIFAKCHLGRERRRTTVFAGYINGLRMQMSALKEPLETSLGIAQGLVNVRNVNVFINGIRFAMS